jgi:hypothetical protein
MNFAPVTHYLERLMEPGRIYMSAMTNTNLVLEMVVCMVKSAFDSCSL